MARFIAFRVAMAIPLLLAVSILIFVLMQLLPGNVMASILPAGASPSTIATLKHELGLDHPLPVRFGIWLVHLLHGNFGFSPIQERSVSSLLAAAWKNTALLAVFTAIFGITTGATIGIVSAFFRGKWVDRLFSSISLAGLSIPSFWLAIVLLIIFGATLKILPTQGTGAGTGAGIWGFIQHLIMPMVAGGMVTQGITAKVTRASMIEALEADYVTTLRAKGLGTLRIAWHALKNAMNPILATSGLQVGYLLGGQVLTETIFSWPGLGLLMYNAISSRDLQVVQGALLVISGTFVAINLIVDILQALVNPSLRKVMA
jgi:peptide/nickel transport system permease protein